MVESVSPAMGVRRAAARRVLQLERYRQKQLGRTYEAAKNDRLRGYDWAVERVSTDQALDEDLESIRWRARDLYRNDAVVSGVIEDRVQKIVGDVGIQPIPQIDVAEMTARANNLSSPHERREAMASIPTEDEVSELNATLSTLWDEWQPHSDAAGLLSFVDQEQQIQRNWDNDGEILVLITFDETDDDKPVPLALRVINAARLETPLNEVSNPLIRLGVEYDENDKRIAYHIRESNGSLDGYSTTYLRIPIRDGNNRIQIVHLFEQQWPDQSRGVPYISPVATKIKDLKDWDENELVAKAMESALAIFIKKAGSSEGLFPANDEVDETTPTGDRIKNIRTGSINYLEVDESIETVNPQRPGSNYAPFVEWQTLRIAGALCWPYEWLVKDYRRTSFSAGRLAGIDGGIVIRHRQRKYNDHLLRLIWPRFVEQAFLSGQVQIDPIGWNLLRKSFTRYRYAGPVRPPVDILKETQAMVLMIQNRLATYAEYYASKGQQSYADAFRQIAKEQDLIEDLAIAMLPAASPEGVPKIEDEPAGESDGESASVPATTPAPEPAEAPQ